MGRGRPLFSIRDFGTPFESRLDAFFEPSRGGEGGEGGEAPNALRFELRIQPLWPTVFAAALALTIWPGVWLTESLLETYFPGSWIARYTWWWYMPLTAPFCPWAWWAAIRKSRITGRGEADKLRATIAETLAEASAAQ